MRGLRHVLFCDDYLIKKKEKKYSAAQQEVTDSYFNLVKYQGQQSYINLFASTRIISVWT